VRFASPGGYGLNDFLADCSLLIVLLHGVDAENSAAWCEAIEFEGASCLADGLISSRIGNLEP